MEKPTIEKSIILLEEIRKLLIANYNDRPNAVASFGTAKLNSRDVKEIFDKQFKFLAEKHNALASGTAAEIEKHKSDVSDELEDHKAATAAEIAKHKDATAAEIAAHKAEVDGALEAQDEEIDGAVSSAAEAVRIADELKARADAGEFKGDPGKKGDKGDPGSISFIIVTELPEEDIDESAIYLVPSENPSEDNKFIEYFYANGRWEMLPGGGINVDLTEYLKKSDFATAGQIVEKVRTNKYLSPYYLDEIMRIGLTTNAKVLTDEEKAAALAWLGVNQYVDNAIAAITDGEEVAY